MAFNSIKNVLAQAGLTTPAQFDEWCKAWRVALESGSQESLIAFFSRESGLSEEVLLHRLAQALGWPFLELSRMSASPDVQKRISTRVASHYTVIPTCTDNGT